MKKFLVLSALVITSCTLSNEEKAEKLVKETLKDYLYHPDSYEPISTRVDSMFIDVTTIEPIMKISDEIKNLISKGEFYQFNLSSCIRQQNSLTAQFVSFSLSNLANIFYPPQFLQ